MSARIQVTFRGMPPSDYVREVVGQRLRRLSTHGMDGARCHVVVERRGAGPTKTAGFDARLALHGVGNLVASDAADGDALVAVRTAFDRVEAQVRRVLASRRPHVGRRRLAPT
jgi:ribosome-associated translation inhibitor RaiA